MYKLVLIASAGLLAGCAFEGGVPIRVDGNRVTESLTFAQSPPHKVSGVATRSRRVAQIECPTAIAYDVFEATGHAVLMQTYALRLRTAPLRVGTTYALECDGPVIVELPDDAAALTVVPAGFDVAPVASVPFAFRKRLVPERGTTLFAIRSRLAPGHYGVGVSSASAARRWCSASAAADSDSAFDSARR
jgi:hypothetical protein